MDLYNYNIIDFNTKILPIEYDMYTQVCKSLSPINELHGVTIDSVEELPFKTIITLENMFKNLFTNPLLQIDIVSVVFNVDTEEIKKLGIFDFYPRFNFIHDGLNILLERERKVLNYDPEPDEMEAGIDRMNKFGRLSTVDSLAGGNILLHEEVTNLPYSRIFTKLYLESEKSKLTRELNKIRMRKYDS